MQNETSKIGFAPFGVPLAWAIFTVHFKEDWYVVGGGKNGWEYSFLLIIALLSIMYPTGLKKVTIPERLFYRYCTMK